MVVIIVYIGIITTLGEIIVRSNLYRRRSSSDDKVGAAIALIGMGMLLL